MFPCFCCRCRARFVWTENEEGLARNVTSSPTFFSFLELADVGNFSCKTVSGASDTALGMLSFQQPNFWGKQNIITYALYRSTSREQKNPLRGTKLYADWLEVKECIFNLHSGTALLNSIANYLQRLFDYSTMKALVNGFASRMVPQLSRMIPVFARVSTIWRLADSPGAVLVGHWVVQLRLRATSPGFFRNCPLHAPSILMLLRLLKLSTAHDGPTS